MTHNVRRPAWIVRQLGVTLALSTTACSSQSEPAEIPVAVVTVRTVAQPPRRAPVPAVASTPVADRPPVRARPRSAFVDPPLPVELVDPPGLAPLPPRPPFDRSLEIANTTQGGSLP